MIDESWEKVARRWASWGEAAMRRRGGGEGRVCAVLRFGEALDGSGEPNVAGANC